MENIANKNIVVDRSDPIWFKDVKILFMRDRISEFFPNEEMTTIEKLNAVMRMTIYMGVLLAVLCRNYLYLYIPLICGGITWAIYTVQSESGDIDAKVGLLSTSLGVVKESAETVSKDCIDGGKGTCDECVMPTDDNPFMNYNQITSKRDREPACVSYDDKIVKDKIENKFNVNLYRDVSDLYGKRNSQREFYTTPGSLFEGGVGDQTSFAKWCYNTAPTCKENGIQCTGNYVPEMYTATPVVNL